MTAKDSVMKLREDDEDRWRLEVQKYICNTDHVNCERPQDVIFQKFCNTIQYICNTGEVGQIIPSKRRENNGGVTQAASQSPVSILS